MHTCIVEPHSPPDHSVDHFNSPIKAQFFDFHSWHRELFCFVQRYRFNDRNVTVALSEFYSQFREPIEQNPVGNTHPLGAGDDDIQAHQGDRQLGIEAAEKATHVMEVLTGEGEKAKGEAKKEKENVKAKANAEL
ncbi:hypothetical protein B0H10DRAFT_1939288 [Mycena sp. CBHHK59/15]|nr:hypothetical protein B0H10DRAFT_1939288 [Mycena sp. CBHHK59/15]